VRVVVQVPPGRQRSGWVIRQVHGAAARGWGGCGHVWSEGRRTEAAAAPHPSCPPAALPLLGGGVDPYHARQPPFRSPTPTHLPASSSPPPPAHLCTVAQAHWKAPHDSHFAATPSCASSGRQPFHAARAASRAPAAAASAQGSCRAAAASAGQQQSRV
jgi:hypothetical protein